MIKEQIFIQKMFELKLVNVIAEIIAILEVVKHIAAMNSF